MEPDVDYEAIWVHSEILHALIGWGEQKDLESGDSDPQLAQKCTTPLKVPHPMPLQGDSQQWPTSFLSFSSLFLLVFFLEWLTSPALSLSISVNPTYFSNGLSGILLPEGWLS